MDNIWTTVNQRKIKVIQSLASGLSFYTTEKKNDGASQKSRPVKFRLQWWKRIMVMKHGRDRPSPSITWLTITIISSHLDPWIFSDRLTCTVLVAQYSMLSTKRRLDAVSQAHHRACVGYTLRFNQKKFTNLRRTNSPFFPDLWSPVSVLYVGNDITTNIFQSSQKPIGIVFFRGGIRARQRLACHLLL